MEQLPDQSAQPLGMNGLGSRRDLAAEWRNGAPRPGPRARALGPWTKKKKPGRPRKKKDPNTSPEQRYARLRISARKRGLALDLDLEAWIKAVKRPCHYCGGPLSPTGSGLDRIDNALGYVAGNVLPACGTCNVLRGALLTRAQMEEIGPFVAKWRAEGSLLTPFRPGRPKAK